MSLPAGIGIGALLRLKNEIGIEPTTMGLKR